jgi:hypothetical protein
MTTAIRPHATFGTTQKNTSGVLGRSQTMYSAISNNIAMFAGLPVTMQAFLALITALAAAQQATTGTKAKGTASTRNSKRNDVWAAMVNLQSCVQGLADKMSVADGTTLIEAAGLLVAKTATRQKDTLTATLTAAQGSVHLAANRTVLVGTANAHKRVTFNWEMSADGGKTWQALPSGSYASTSASGLTLMTTYAFRVSVTVGNTPGAWSQAVSILVH